MSENLIKEIFTKAKSWLMHEFPNSFTEYEALKMKWNNRYLILSIEQIKIHYKHDKRRTLRASKKDKSNLDR